MDMNDISKIKYRPEIDGLRAIAVIGVIINHLNNSFLASGYLGVDIFFVISGYVITSSLSNKKINKNFLVFITEFYSRRIKRLIPALIVYVLLISILICIYIPQKDVFLRTGITSLFGLSNLYLLRQSTDYFAQSTVLNPFTHTWSLGVEEQFYFLFPIIIWISGFAKKTKKGINNFFYITLSLSVTSLICFIILYNKNISSAYFLMPTRFWELSAGCLTFIIYEKLRNKNYFRFSPNIILLLIITIFTLPKSLGLITTISIVLLVILLLLSISENSLAFKFLTSKTSLFIGSISYSLYLWHWGILSISKWIGLNNSFINITIVLFLSLIASIFSYYFIENKFRYLSINKIYTILIGIASIIFSSFLIKFPMNNLLKFSGNDMQDIEFKKNLFITNSENRKCKKISLLPIQWTKCEVLNKKNNSIIILTGDSMSRSLIPLANQFFIKDNYDFIEFNQSGTLSPPILFKERQKNNDKVIIKINNQKEYLKKAFKHVQDENYENKFLWIFNDLNFYFYGREWQKNEIIFLDNKNKEIDTRLAFDTWMKSLENLIKKAQEKKINILYFGTIPSIQIGYEVVCAKELNSEKLNINKMCKDNVIKRRSSIQGKYIKDNLEEKIKKLQNKNKNFFYIDTAKTFCKDLANCEIYEKGKLFMSDSVHISPRKAIDLYPLIKQIIYSSSLTK